MEMASYWKQIIDENEDWHIWHVVLALHCVMQLWKRASKQEGHFNLS